MRMRYPISQKETLHGTITIVAYGFDMCTLTSVDGTLYVNGPGQKKTLGKVSRACQYQYSVYLRTPMDDVRISYSRKCKYILIKKLKTQTSESTANP